jgi:hypothetical protein
MHGETEPAVAAIGQLLPFRDEAFDGTFDLLAAAQYLAKDLLRCSFEIQEGFLRSFAPRGVSLLGR